MDPTAFSTSGKRFQTCLADMRASQEGTLAFGKPLEMGRVLFSHLSSSDQAEAPLH